MSGRALRLALLAVLATAQLGVPWWMIAQREKTLAEGESFRFLTAPVDPVDFFRGRYVALGFEQARIPKPAGGPELRAGERYFARIERDAEEFARIAELLAEPPADGAYIKVRLRWLDDDQVFLNLPFDRYYLEEDLAPVVEAAYRRPSRGAESEAWAAVRILDGYPVLEELYLGGKPVREFLEEQAKKAE